MKLKPLYYDNSGNLQTSWKTEKKKISKTEILKGNKRKREKLRLK